MLWCIFIPIILYLTYKNLAADTFMWDTPATRSFLTWCGFVFWTCFTSALISTVPIGLAIYIGSLPAYYGIIDQEYELITLREKDGFSGRSYFLGVGYIHDTQYYFWYRKDPQGYISGGKTLRNSCVELYETTDTPKMVTFKTVYVSPSVAKWWWLVGIDVRGPKWCDRFFIPKGSIKEDFTL